MCKCIYCESKIKSTVKLMENFPIMDDFSENTMDGGEGVPKQYIRRYSRKYFLVTEFANDEGDVITCKILFCPMCGRKLT